MIKYKYTGQEEDRETGLYYYKARYYDPALGRFISPDTMYFKDQLMGMNRYMYVGGNPVKYNDPTGHYSQKNFLQDLAKHMINEEVKKMAETSVTAAFALNAWGQKMMYRIRKHRGMRNDLVKFASFAVNPLNGIGFQWAALNYMVGQAMGKKPSLKFVRGGVVVQGGGLMQEGFGIALGNFVTTGGHDKGTYKHELAHLRQTSEIGSLKYFSHLASTPFLNLGWIGGKTPYYENDANRRAGAFGSYDAGYRFNELLPLMIILDNGRRKSEINQMFLDGKITFNNARNMLSAESRRFDQDMFLFLFLEGIEYVP